MAAGNYQSVLSHGLRAPHASGNGLSVLSHGLIVADIVTANLEWEMPVHTATWANPEDAVAGTAEQVLTLTIGEDAVLSFTTSDPPGGGIGDWTLLFSVAPHVGADPVLEVDGDDITIDDAAAGNFTVTVGRESTSDLIRGSYAWSVWRVDEGSQTPLASGVLDVRGSARG